MKTTKTIEVEVVTCDCCNKECKKYATEPGKQFNSQHYCVECVTEMASQVGINSPLNTNQFMKEIKKLDLISTLPPGYPINPHQPTYSYRDNILGDPSCQPIHPNT